MADTAMKKKSFENVFFLPGKYSKQSKIERCFDPLATHLIQLEINQKFNLSWGPHKDCTAFHNGLISLLISFDELF